MEIQVKTYKSYHTSWTIYSFSLKVRVQLHWGKEVRQEILPPFPGWKNLPRVLDCTIILSYEYTKKCFSSNTVKIMSAYIKVIKLEKVYVFYELNKKTTRGKKTYPLMSFLFPCPTKTSIIIKVQERSQCQTKSENNPGMAWESFKPLSFKK